MTRSELIELMADQLRSIPESQIEEGVKALFEVMSESLVAGERIELRGFGSFELHYRASGQARNPKTGEQVEVDDRFVAHFKPGKLLRDRVNKGRDLQ